MDLSSSEKRGEDSSNKGRRSKDGRRGAASFHVLLCLYGVSGGRGATCSSTCCPRNERHHRRLDRKHVDGLAVLDPQYLGCARPGVRKPQEKSVGTVGGGGSRRRRVCTPSGESRAGVRISPLGRVANQLAGAPSPSRGRRLLCLVICESSRGRRGSPRLARERAGPGHRSGPFHRDELSNSYGGRLEGA